MNEFASIQHWTDASGNLTVAARQWHAGLVAELRAAQVTIAAQDVLIAAQELLILDLDSRITALEP